MARCGLYQEHLNQTSKFLQVTVHSCRPLQWRPRFRPADDRQDEGRQPHRKQDEGRQRNGGQGMGGKIMADNKRKETWDAHQGKLEN